MGFLPPPRPSLPVFLLISAAACTALAEFSERPDSFYGVVEGESLTVRCNSTSGRFFLWEKDGREIDETDSFVPDLTVGEGWLTISRANRSHHSGQYLCRITELDSNPLISKFNISVYYIGSSITLRRTYPECVPDVGTAYVTSTLSLECLPPDGYPMVNVTWYRNGIKIRQVENPQFINFSNSRRKLVLGPLFVNFTGSYHCQAANEANRGSPLKSEPLQITVTYPRTNSRTVMMVESDQPLVVGEGLSAELECRILPPISVQDVVWLHNTDTLTHNSTEGIRIVQRNHSELTCINSLHLENVSASSAGIYECRDGISIINHHAQRQLSLAVLEGPLVVKATPTHHLAAGKTLRLTCELIEGAPPQRNNVSPEDFAYNWTHNGSAQLRVEGGESQLLIPAVALEDSGLYVCLVSSPRNGLSSISASLYVTVEAIPRALISLLGSDSVFDRVEGNVVYVQLGAYVLLQCTLESTTPSNFTWLRKVEGEPELQEISHSLSLSSFSTLSLPHLTPSQLTTYSCHVTNDVHDVVAGNRLTLTETQRPYVRDTAVGVKGAEFGNGTTLELVCEARGGSGDDLVWMRGNMELTNQTTARGLLVVIVTHGNNSTLMISGVTTKEAGLYDCVMRLAGGMESKLTYNVTVRVPAKIEYTSSPDVTAAIGDQVQFDCVASGVPPPTISWLFDTRPVEEVETLQDLGNGSLRISSVTQDHGGSYHCFLDSGEISQKFTLSVEEDGAEGDSLQCGGGFSQKDCITLLSGGSLAVLLLLLTFLVLLVCVCVLCRRWTREAYDVPRDFETKRALSSRASSHKDNGAAPAICDLNGVGETQGFRNGLYPVNPPVSLFGGTALADMQRSVTPPAPSPVLHTPGTGGTDSMFSSDDQSSLTATLPNYPRAKLTLGEELGEGEFGPVLLGVARNIVSHEEATQVVVKVLVRSGDRDDHFQPDLALVDFANQMKIDYEHVACILGLCTDMEPYYVIYEYLDQGDLKKYLLTHQPVPGQQTPLSPHILSRLVLQVADGMAFLFSQRIIHGDLATRNCLVSTDNHVKIADLGIGHDLYQTDYYDNGTQLLPIRWMPPELLVATDDGPAFSLYSDIWSFGVLCWEVFTFGELPFEGVADEEVLQRVPEGLTLPLPPSDGCPGHMIRAMQQCWEREPEARPRFSALCMEMNIISGE